MLPPRYATAPTSPDVPLRGYLEDRESAFARLGIATDAETLTGIQRLIKERVTETRHLDFKRQLNNIDDLADDMSALANVGAVYSSSA